MNVDTTPEMALDALNVGAIRRRFAGEVLGTHLYVFNDVASTNAVLRDLADGGAQEGAVVLSETQRAGRGRFDTPWYSPPGVNLYISVLLRPVIQLSAVPVFSFIASLALSETMWTLGVPAGVKWPNDVTIRGRKVAGTRLDVGMAGDRVTYVVVGVGINVNVRHAQLEVGLGAAAKDATSLREAVGHPVDRNTVASGFLNELEKWLTLYRSAGPEPIVSAWQKRDVLTGHRVAIQAPDGTFMGRVAGIDTGGFLVVHDDEGVRHTVVSAAVRLVDECGSTAHDRDH